MNCGAYMPMRQSSLAPGLADVEQERVARRGRRRLSTAQHTAPAAVLAAR